MAEEPTRPARTTWRDPPWMSPGTVEPDGLLTRGELLAELHRRGVEATTADLRFWEYRGLLPAPVRRWHRHATRAVYAPWCVALVVALRELQRDGASLADAGAKLRRLWTEAMGFDAGANKAGSPDRFAELFAINLLTPHLARMANVHQAVTGQEVAEVKAAAFAPSGEMVAYIEAWQETGRGVSESDGPH